ncbi:PEP-CTERM sorting domain-containing protein [Coraliomargarita sp. W4R53]
MQSHDLAHSLSLKSVFSTAVCVASLYLASSAGVHAQVSFDNLSDVYNADFNVSINSSQPRTWTDNSTIAGWWARADNAAATTYNVSAGTNGVDGMMAYSPTAPNALGADAFGSLNSGTGSGNLLAVELYNNTGATITDVKVSFTQVQWYAGNGGANDKFAASYNIGGSAPVGGTFTLFSGLDVDGLVSGVGGLATPVSQNVSATISDISWGDGESLWIRWIDSNVSGGDAGAGFSAMSITVPEPSSAALLAGVTILALVGGSRRRKNG